MKKGFRRIVLISSLVLLCTSCNDELRTYDGSKAYNTVWSEQPKNMCSYFPMGNYVVYKIDSSFSKKIQYEDYLIIDSNKQVVASSHDVESNNQNLIMISLFDETCWETYFWSGKKKIYKLYFELEKVEEFLNKYDYFYLYGAHYFSLTVHKKGKETEINEAICASFKNYHLLPFKDNKLKLDELFNFYRNFSSMPYDYNLIAKKEYLTNGIESKPFTYFFWNDMTDEDLLNSFNQLTENPPSFECERCFE